MTPPRITIANLHADLDASAAHFRADASAVERSRARVEAALSDGRAHYGINTGFGALANTRVPDDQLARLQRNLLFSHAVGVGDPVPRDITRVMLRLKIHALGLGYSGVSVPPSAACSSSTSATFCPWSRAAAASARPARSEERRVGEECTARR